LEESFTGDVMLTRSGMMHELLGLDLNEFIQIGMDPKALEGTFDVVISIQKSAAEVQS
jgi:hypothetical protein